MKIRFEHIKERLGDPFFEMRFLGREAIRTRTLSLEQYGIAADNISFIEWLPGDNSILIEYSFYDSHIGRVLIASTSKGVCFLGFVTEDDETVEADFFSRFPNQPVEEITSEFHKTVLEFCQGNTKTIIPLHLKGTDFQIAIWKKLLLIPSGRLTTYGSLAEQNRGARALGRAVGANPVSYIVPCHRVVRSDGRIEGYHWGTAIKKALLCYEFLTYEESE